MFFEEKQKAETVVYQRFQPSLKWSEWRDLNSRPLDPQSSALPTAPHPDNDRYITTFNYNMQYFFEKN